MSEYKNAIYDDNSFFNNYLDLRNKKNNYNDLIEQPIVFSLLGDLHGKSALDIGCGYGAMTKKLIEAGATNALGIDVSENMISKAIAENTNPNIHYKVLNAEHLGRLNQKFDVIVSCLAIHYIENFAKLFSDIYNLLNDNGIFVFSMEHPTYTASIKSQEWIEDESGKATGFVMDHYGYEGERNIEWLGKAIKKYHHKTDTTINALIENKFILEKVIEPSPSEELMQKVPKTIHELHRPAYLIIKCHKG